MGGGVNGGGEEGIQRLRLHGATGIDRESLDRQNEENQAGESPKVACSERRG